MNLNQITIPSVQVDVAVGFYKTLGLRLIVDALPEYARFECPEGEATFSIYRVDELQKGKSVTIYFEENHLDEYVNKLQTKGIKFDELPKDKPWLWREAHLRDPDGHAIILYYAGKNRKNPTWRIE
jgi:catechol 2,3-dioxygenase-like lactoylglutathione lyase family enzyme